MFPFKEGVHHSGPWGPQAEGYLANVGTQEKGRAAGY
jgi:hypothetical protein